MLHFARFGLRARRYICAAGAVAALAGCGSTAGRVLTWPSASSAVGDSSTFVAVPGQSQRASSSQPSGNTSLPAALWKNLNENTAATAQGEWLLINELKKALEAQLMSLFTSGGH